MCQRCQPIIGVLTIDQGRTLSIIRSAWNGVCVYDTDNFLGDGKILVVGHLGSEYHFSIVASDGSRQIVSDPLNQSHWLEMIHGGELPLLWREPRPEPNRYLVAAARGMGDLPIGSYDDGE